MSDALMQLISIGHKNNILSSICNTHCLGLNNIQMHLITNVKKNTSKDIVQNHVVNYYHNDLYLESVSNCAKDKSSNNFIKKYNNLINYENTLIYNPEENLNQYTYDCCVSRCQEMLKFVSISIELDENLIDIQNIDNIWSSILNSYLEIYSHEIIHDNKKQEYIDGDNTYFICQIPLYLLSQKFTSNECIFKFAKNTFIPNDYFMSANVRYEIKIIFGDVGKYIKNINLLGISKYIIDYNRKILKLCIENILFRSIQYVKNIPIENALVYCDNEYVLKTKMNMIGFVKELFFNIPNELVCSIKKINIALCNYVDKYNNSNIISFVPSDGTNKLVNTNDICGVYFGGLNQIDPFESFNSFDSFDLEQNHSEIKTTINDYVELIFDKEIVEYIDLIKKISIGALCTNDLIICEGRSKLKYNQNTGELNDELDLHEIDMMEKYANHKNNEMLVENILSKMNNKHDENEKLKLDNYKCVQNIINKFV